MNYSYVDGKYYDNGVEIDCDEVQTTNNQDLLSFILEIGNDDWASEFAAQNPNCPARALAKVLERGKDDWVSRFAASNPNCSSEALVKVLERGNDDLVSIFAITNTNFSPEEKIEFYYKINKNITFVERQSGDGDEDEDILKKFIEGV